MERMMSLVGILVLYGIAIAMSNNRGKINWKTIGIGFGFQFILGVFLLKIPITRDIFAVFTTQITAFLELADAGAAVVFGPLLDYEKIGFVLGIKILTTIIFFSALMSVLYYLGIIQIVINIMAKVMRKFLGTSGSETLSCAANIFVGQTEAPLLVKPYLNGMTKSELMTIMTGGFATIAGSVLAAYIGLGVPAEHLIVASVMSAPGALVVAKIIYPETEHSETAGDAKLPEISVGDNILDAAARGTTDGLNLALNVLAMLISFIALVAVVDYMLAGADWVIDHRLLGTETIAGSGVYTDAGWFPASLKVIFGTIFAPLAFIMGVPMNEAGLVGNLLGQKIMVNEFLAYASLTELINSGQLSDRSIMIASYALCGFANLSSIGIQLGGIGALAPDRRSDLAKVGLKAMIAGAITSFITACIAGVLVF